MVVYLSLSSCESCLFFDVGHLNLYIRNTEYPCKNKKNVGNYQIMRVKKLITIYENQYFFTILFITKSASTMADSFSSLGASFDFHATMKRIRAAVILSHLDKTAVFCLGQFIEILRVGTSKLIDVPLKYFEMKR